MYWNMRIERTFNSYLNPRKIDQSHESNVESAYVVNWISIRTDLLLFKLQVESAYLVNWIAILFRSSSYEYKVENAYVVN